MLHQGRSLGRLIPDVAAYKPGLDLPHGVLSMIGLHFRARLVRLSGFLLPDYAAHGQEKKEGKRGKSEVLFSVQDVARMD